MIRQKDVNVTRAINGSYDCAAMVGRRRFHMRYMGYTKREAVRLFCAYVNWYVNFSL